MYKNASGKKNFEYGLDYGKIRQVVKRSCEESGENEFSFSINIDKMEKAIEKMGLDLIPIIVSSESKPIEAKDVMLLYDYYKSRTNRITWLDSYKELLTVIFVQPDSGKYEEGVEANRDNIIQLANSADFVEGLAEIVNDYTCYFVTIISYNSNDPRMFGRLSYDIRCRCNQRVIKPVDDSATTSTETEDTTDKTIYEDAREEVEE